MASMLKLRWRPTLFASGFLFAICSLLIVSPPANAIAEDEKPSDAPGKAAPADNVPPAGLPPKDAAGEDAPPASFPPPDAPGSDAGTPVDGTPVDAPPAPDLPEEEPVAPKPVPAEVAQTLFDENVRTCGPMVSSAEWRKLSQLIVRLAKESAARARKSPKFLLGQWGATAPKSARLTLRISVTIRDVPLGEEARLVADRPPESGVLQPMMISSDTLEGETSKLIRKSHTLALRDAAAEFSALKKAGYTGMIELRSSLMVSLMGAPVDPEAAAAAAAGMRPTMSADDKLEEKAQNLMWYAQKARDAKDMARMKNILSEILALPLNKQTAGARRLLDAYSVTGY